LVDARVRAEMAGSCEAVVENVARLEIEKVFGPDFIFRHVPLTAEIRIYFFGAGSWYVALPTGIRCWHVDVRYMPDDEAEPEDANDMPGFGPRQS
jgi:hypothetical protein